MPISASQSIKNQTYMYNKTQSDYIKNAPGACWCWQFAHVEENNAPMCNEFMRSKIDIRK